MLSIMKSQITPKTNTLSRNNSQKIKPKYYKKKLFVFGLGIAISYLTYRFYTSPSTDQFTYQRKPYGWTVKAYTLLPLRAVSGMFGLFNSVTLPVWSRDFSFRFYCLLFNCNLEEMKNKNLRDYKNLKEFFMREINPDLRPISEAVLTSPSDGRVLHFGKIDSGQIEQIKGHSYNIVDLIGKKLIGKTNTVQIDNNDKGYEVVNEKEFSEINDIQYSIDDLLLGNKEKTLHKDELRKIQLKINPENEMFFAVVYLAPGDYHRFHSPANWVVNKRRHFAGELYSVSPKILNLIPDLFVLNERIVLMGKWKFGRFIMAPIGATNVGSIKINFDKDIKRRKLKTKEIGTYSEVIYKSSEASQNGYYLKKGQEIGAFSLGSTVLLIFEAPKNFEFHVTKNQVIKYGESIGDINKESQ